MSKSYAARLTEERSFRTARTGLLLIAACTVLNIILLYCDSTVYLLFSASVPYYVALIAYLLNSPLLLIGAGVILLLYFLCWLFSNKHPGWLIAATVLFALDTLLFFVLGIDVGERRSIMELMFHILVLFYLMIGTISGFQMRKASELATDEPAFSNTVPLRVAETDVKHRVLLEAEAPGMVICYRRVKLVNQLLINGYVYAEMPPKWLEFAHELTAVYQDVPVAAGFDGTYSYIAVNGQVISRKKRVF